MVCRESACFEGVRKIVIPDCAITLHIGYEAGVPFSVLISDSRYGDQGHMHFPAGDIPKLSRFVIQEVLRGNVISAQL